jgi:hypothetical protein
MDNQNIEFRVNRLKKRIEEFASLPENKFTLEPVSSELIDQLRAQDNFPLDMLMILEQIGCMRNWGYKGIAMIDWWIPSSFQNALAEYRSLYELYSANFKNPENLLFFAQDCEANCYFYDKTTVPFKLVICDGLSASEDPKSYSKTYPDWDDKITPREEADSHDAISIIERWADLYK